MSTSLPRKSLLVLLAVMMAMPLGGAEPVGLFLDFVDSTGCDPTLPLGPCLVGHDAGTQPGPADDTYYASTVLERATLTVDVGALPRQDVVVDYDETYVEHPLFVTLEGAWLAANDALPDQVHRYARLRSGTTANGLEGMWVSVSPYAILPLFPEDATQYVPIVVYWPHVVERERVYPLNTGGTERVESDEVVGAAGYAGGLCRPEEQALAPAVCAARGAASAQVAQALMERLPNVGLSGGVRRAEVLVGDAAALLGASVDSSRASPWSFSSGSRPAATPSEAVEQSGSQPGVDMPLAASQPPHASSSVVALPSYGGEGAALADGAGLVVALATAAGLFIAWVLYRRLRTVDLLHHPSRRRVIDLVGERPGISVADVAQALGSDYKTAQHHVDLLVEAAMVSVHLLGRQRRLFPAARAYDRRTCDAVLVRQRSGAQRLLAALVTLGPLPRSELRRCSGLSPAGAWENLRDLERVGVVAIEGEGRSALVRLVPSQATGEGGPTATNAPAP